MRGLNEAQSLFRERLLKRYLVRLDHAKAVARVDVLIHEMSQPNVRDWLNVAQEIRTAARQCGITKSVDLRSLFTKEAVCRKAV